MRGGAKRFDAGELKMLFCSGLAVALRPAQQRIRTTIAKSGAPVRPHLGACCFADLIRCPRALACVAALSLAWVCLSCTNTPAEQQAQQQKKAPEILEIPSGNFTANWRAELALGQAQPKAIYVNDDKVLVYTS